MNDRPTRNIWRRPWKGWVVWLAWFIILFAISAIGIASLGLLSGVAKGNEIIGYTLVVALGTALLGILLIGLFRCLIRWMNLRRLVFGLAVLATLIAGFYAEENLRGRLAWNAYVRLVESRGDTLNATQLIPPTIPDEKNFTLCPFLKPIFDFEVVPLERGAKWDHKVVWNDTNGLARIDKFNVDAYVESRIGRYEPGYDSSWPMTTPPTEEQEGEDLRQQADRIKDTLSPTNGWVNLKGFESYLLLATNADDVGLTASTATNVLRLMGVFDPGLNELKTCSKQRPLSRWSIFYDTNDPPGILLPHLARVRQFVQLLQLHAAANLAAGQSAQAMQDLGLGFRFAESVRNEPFLISQLVRIAALQILVQPVKEGLARRQFSDAQLRGLQMQFAGVDLLESAEYSMKAERSWFGVMTCEAMRRDRRYLCRTVGSEGLQPVLLHLMPSGWLYQNQLVMCKWQDRFGLAPIDLENHRIHPSEENAADRELAEMRGPYNFLGRIFLPAVSKVLMRFAEGQTLVDQSVIACALERYRLAKGHYPAELAALSPEFLEHVPPDIITGNPMIYRARGDGTYVLYATGWDGHDDGGTPSKGKRYDPEGNEDWVWTLPDPDQRPY